MAETAATAGGRLHHVVTSGGFAVTAELPPPRGASLEAFRRTARAVKAWVDAINVTDGQSAHVRVASWAGSIALLQEGVEPVMQVQCRDRNRIALQSDLLSAAAFHVPNVLILGGDPPSAGDDPDAKPVFDLDSVTLMRVAKGMRDDGVLMSGRTIPTRPRFMIGAAENPFSPPEANPFDRFAAKVEAGASFVQTQFVFDVPAFRRWFDEAHNRGLTERCAVIAGVGPIRSPNALAMLQKLPGTHIPDTVVKRLTGVPEERFAAEGVALCAEIIQQLREVPGLRGVHVMAAALEEFLPEVLTRAGLGPRPS